MYGVMVVVEDLDQWLSDPQEPANPIGNNRSFVKSWSVRDLEAEIDAGVRGRTDSIGARLFNEASCRGCHQLAGEGGVIGPDLSKVVAKWKGNRAELLREILEPSHRVDEAYQMQKILTVDGQTLTGIRISEDKEKVVLMSNPEATEPISILQDDIEVMAPSAISMMPKALLDQYTKDEIFEIIAYIEASQQP
jgi:putative heme-binding domain-containing protein